MKFTKILGVVAVAALALMAFASSASATTLEIEGVTQNKEVTIEASLLSGSSALFADTFGFSQNTCTASTVKGHTVSPFTGTTVGGPVTTLGWTGCSAGNPTAHKTGTLSVEAKSGTTSGTVRSSGAEITFPAVGGGTITCTTENTDLGLLTGVATGQARLDINAILSCTSIGTMRWTSTYQITSPKGLGVE
jgi:hypothetical protein